MDFNIIDFSWLTRDDAILFVKGMLGITSVLIIVFGWYAHRKTEQIKIMQNLISEKKNEAYTEFIDLFFELMQASKEGKERDNSKDLDKMLKIKNTMFMYGSDKVYRALNKWLLTCGTNLEPQETIRTILNLLVVIRKDLQHNSTIDTRDILVNIMQSEKEISQFIQPKWYQFWKKR